MFEIGSSLREARLRKSLDFPEIESDTKIRGKYLQALEEERFDLLPGESYIKGFLRNYAEYLGLDGQVYVDEFNSRYVAPAEVQSIRARRTAQARRQRRLQGGVLVSVLLGIALVTALVIVAWTAGSPAKQAVPGVTTAPKTTTTRHGHARRTPSIVLRATRAPVFLVAVHRGGPAGEVLFQNKELAAGHFLRFKARKLWVNSGTTSGLVVIVNGKQKPLPSSRPQAFVITKSGISPSA